MARGLNQCCRQGGHEYSIQLQLNLLISNVIVMPWACSGWNLDTTETITGEYPKSVITQ